MSSPPTTQSGPAPTTVTPTSPNPSINPAAQTASSNRKSASAGAAAAGGEAGGPGVNPRILIRKKRYAHLGLPLVVVVVGGAYVLSHFVETRIELRDRQNKAGTMNTRKYTIQEEHAMIMKNLDIDNYTLSKIPEPTGDVAAALAAAAAQAKGVPVPDDPASLVAPSPPSPSSSAEARAARIKRVSRIRPTDDSIRKSLEQQKEGENKQEVQEKSK